MRLVTTLPIGKEVSVVALRDGKNGLHLCIRTERRSPTTMAQDEGPFFPVPQSHPTPSLPNGKVVTRRMKSGICSS